jgi:transcriptional regulator with XRE-family HTH domain
MKVHPPTTHAKKNSQSYRRLERTHKSWRTIRHLFDLSIEEVAFFIVPDGSNAHSSLERRAKHYYATLLDYERLERAKEVLRVHRLRQQLSLGEAAFLLAGEGPAKPSPNKLRAARQGTGLSQADVAHLIGTSRFMLSRYEAGRSDPDVVTAMILSVLYEPPLNRLFPRQGALRRHLKRRERMLAAWRRVCQPSPGRNRRSLGGGGLKGDQYERADY